MIKRVYVYPYFQLCKKSVKARSDTGLPDAAEFFLSVCGRLSNSFCTEEEKEKLRAVFKCIPRTGNFIHGDCHPANAALNNGGIRFFDLTFAGKGHPVFDLLGMYSHYVFLPSFITEDDCKTKTGMTKTEAAALYDRFLDACYPDKNASELSQIREYIRGVHAAVICLASAAMPGVFTDEMLAEAKRRALRFSEEHCLNTSADLPLPI